VLVGGLSAAIASVLTLAGAKAIAVFAAALLPALLSAVLAMANAAAAAVVYRRLAG